MLDPSNLPPLVFDIGTKIVGEHVGQFVFGAVVGGGSGALYTAWLVRRIIRNGGRLKGPIADIQTTWYTPAIQWDSTSNAFEWVVNPTTHKGFYDQKIRTEEAPIRLRDIFNDEADSKTSRAVARRIEKYIERAAENCNGNPIVFAHLGEVIGKKDLDHVTSLMSNRWKSYFSGLYRDTKRVLTDRLEDNQLHFEKTILPTLIREEGALGNQYRILLIELNQDNTFDLPPMQQVLFKMPDGSFQHNAKSVQDDRYYALKEIKRYLATADGQDYIKKFSVAVPTGEFITVRRPEAIGAAPC